MIAHQKDTNQRHTIFHRNSNPQYNSRYMDFKKLKIFTSVFCMGALVFGSLLIVLKILRPRRRMGLAEKTGQNIDLSLKNAADYLEKATTTLQDAAEAGTVKSFGRSIDEAFTEAKAAIDRVKSAVKGATVL